MRIAGYGKWMVCLLSLVFFVGCSSGRTGDTKATATPAQGNSQEATAAPDGGQTASGNRDPEETTAPNDGQTPSSGEQTPSAGGQEVPEPTKEPTPAPTPTTAPDRAFTIANYPTVYADLPDPDIIRVGEAYYMVSTTMNLCPGVPVLKSTDLVHWQIVNYVYDTFEDDNKTNLENGQDMYSRGSWAASLKYDADTGIYYVAFNSNDHGFYIYTTTDIEKGEWERYKAAKYFHDPALFLENGELYVISASGGTCSLQKLGLDKETGRVTTPGFSQKLFTSSDWSLWEGAHAYHAGEYYYVFIIASPKNRWMRTQLCYRSKSLAPGEWEEKVVYQGGSGGQSAGLAQGGIVETQYGDWYAFLFQDRGAAGRVPSVVAVEWQEDWPILGTYNMAGKFCPNQSDYGMRIYLSEDENGTQIVGDDDFSYSEGENLKLFWQWNHNPKDEYWSITDREGFLRLTTDRAVSNLFEAHNSLTQRTVGPSFASEVCLDFTGLKAGDYAGLAAVSSAYGLVGVTCDENGAFSIVQANSPFKEAFAQPEEAVLVKEGEDSVHLRICYDLKGETAEFFYSYDGVEWTKIGSRMKLGFSTNTTFMGTRSWLFCYATKEAGGYADFDAYSCAKGK